MKNLNTILSKSNLSGKERAVLLFINNINRTYNKGKAFEKSELTAMTELHYRRGENVDSYNKLVNEYNKYIDANNNFKDFLTYIEIIKMTTLLKMAHFSKAINYSKNKPSLLQELFNYNREDIIKSLLKDTGLNYEQIKNKAIEKGKENELKELLDKGLIRLKEIHLNILDKEISLEIIPSEQIYFLDEKYFFVKEYKKQIENILIIEYLFKFLEDTKIITEYQGILKTETIFKNISSIYNTDITFIFKGIKEELEWEIRLLLRELRLLFEHLEEKYYFENEEGFCEIFIQKLLDNSIFQTEIEYIDKNIQEMEEKFKGIFLVEWDEEL